MKKKCALCIINENKINKLLKENMQLLNIIEILKTELIDKTEWLESIKTELADIQIDEKNIKELVFKLNKRVNKLT